MRNEICKVCEKNFSVYDSRPPVKYCSVVCKRADYKHWHAVTNKTYIHPVKQKIKKIRFKWNSSTEEEQRIHLQKIFDRSVIRKDGCWDWDGIAHAMGYIPMKHGKKFTWAHRISWFLYFGNIPDGLNVLHKCDNRRCSNPDHLFLGTIQDNIKDMDNKGRRHIFTGAKLSYNEVLEIKKLLLLGVPVARIARDFKMSHPAIKSIKMGATWKHVII